MKSFARKLAGAWGLDIRSRNAPLHTFGQGLVELKRHTKVEGVIDVGVADGTPELYAAFKGHPFLLVEANPEYQDKLTELARKLPAHVERVFCGAASGTVAFNLYTSGRKASAYRTRSKEIKASYKNTIDVPVRTLDELLQRAKLPAPYFLKIDAEGAELDVLRGAANTLKNTAAVLLEASVIKRYEDAPDFSDVVCYMKERGFSVYDMVEGAIEDGRLLMVDLLFIPTSAPLREL